MPPGECVRSLGRDWAVLNFRDVTKTRAETLEKFYDVELSQQSYQKFFLLSVSLCNQLGYKQEELSVGSKSHNTNRLKYVAVPKQALVSLGDSQFIILSLGSVNRCNWIISLEYDYGRKFSLGILIEQIILPLKGLKSEIFQKGQ